MLGQFICRAISLKMTRITGFSCALRLACCVTSLLFGIFTTTSQAQPSPEPKGREMRFDLPSQSLKEALASFDQVTGLSVFFPSELIDGRVSSAVQGIYAPTAALEILLKGSGLIMKYVASDALVLIADEPVEHVVQPVPSLAGERHFSGLVQKQVLKVLCNRDELELGRYRLTMSILFDQDGKAKDVRLLDSTGDRRRDKAILDEVGRIDIQHSPPKQDKPFVLLIRPRVATSSPACPDI